MPFLNPRLAQAGGFKKVKARAKINIALDILGQRADGYHDLRSIMQTLHLHDSLTITATDKSFQLICDDPLLPVDDTNLITQAANFLIKEYKISSGVRIELSKRIPTSAGLGGGSSDCAATLIGMNALFSLDIPLHRLMEIGLYFGADVPFCLLQGTALAEGIGEKLTSLATHPPCWVLLACPDVAVSTATIFKMYSSNHQDQHAKRPNIPQLVDFISNSNLAGIASGLGNVLTSVTTRLHPEIDLLMHQMSSLGALGTCMSGSGPTVFGYFDNENNAVAAQCELKQTIRKVFLTRTFNQEGRF